MHSYATRIYMFVIRMLLLCHSYVLVCYSHNINISVVCHSYVFVYHSYVINMSPVCHSYVLMYYPHAICLSPLYQSYVIRMPLVYNRMSLICVFNMNPLKQIKWYIRLNGSNTILKRLWQFIQYFQNCSDLVVLSCIISN